MAIGSGIIGLGYVANSMGWAPYICFNLFVSVMSIFTLNIVCECSTRVYQWEYKKREREEKELDNRNEGIILSETCFLGLKMKFHYLRIHYRIDPILLDLLK